MHIYCNYIMANKYLSVHSIQLSPFTCFPTLELVHHSHPILSDNTQPNPFHFRSIPPTLIGRRTKLDRTRVSRAQRHYSLSMYALLCALPSSRNATGKLASSILDLWGCDVVVPCLWLVIGGAFSDNDYDDDDDNIYRVSWLYDPSSRCPRFFFFSLQFSRHITMNARGFRAQQFKFALTVAWHVLRNI